MTDAIRTPDVLLEGLPDFPWEPQYRQVGVRRVIDHPAHPGRWQRADVLDVDRLVGANGKCRWA